MCIVNTVCLTFFNQGMLTDLLYHLFFPVVDPCYVISRIIIMQKENSQIPEFVMIGMIIDLLDELKLIAALLKVSFLYMYY